MTACTSRILSRRDLLRVLGLAGGAIALSACAPAVAPTPTAAPPPARPAATASPAKPAEQVPTAAPTAPAREPPVKGGTLTVALGFEPGLLSPIDGAAFDAHLIFRNVYDPLVFLDANGQFRPALARSWEISPDGLTYTFKLREGVKFHDGTPFNAPAVKFTWDTIMDPATKSLTAKDLLGPFYQGVEVVDPMTVRATFSKPYAPFLFAVSRHWLAPVSPEAYKKFGPDYARNQVGTGPFIWKEYVPKERIVLERNEAYNWAPEGMGHQGPAYLDRIVFKFVPEVSVRTGTLRSGEAQLAQDVPPKDVVALKSDQNMALYQSQVPGMVTLLFLNTRKAPTDSLQFRQGLNYAVNKEVLVQSMFSGLNQPAYTLLASNTLGYNKATEMYQHDAEKARSLLDQAGWRVGSGGIREKDGQKAELILNTLAFNRYPEILQVVQAQLKDVGVDMKINVVNFAQFDAAARKDEYHMMPYFTPSFDPYVLGLHFHSHNVAQGFAYSHFTDPKLDQLLDDALSEMNQAKRLELYTQAQQRIMENALVLPLYPFVNNTVARAEVKGLAIDRLGWDPILYDVFLKK